MSKRLILVVTASILMLLISGCTSCDLEGYKDSVNPIIQKWDDAESLALSSPRIALAPQIENLQEIKREAENLKIPECTQKVHKYLVASMDSTIDAFLAFLQQDDNESKSQMLEAKDQMYYYLDELKGLEEK